MTKAQAAQLLTLIAAFDRRTIGETDVEAWHLILGDLDINDCVEAVRAYFTTNRDWLMPADVRTLTERIVRTREGRAKQAQREAEIAAENPPLELSSRPVASLTVGQPVRPARMLAMSVASGKKPAAALDTDAARREQEQREQARREVAERRSALEAQNPDEASDGE